VPDALEILVVVAPGPPRGGEDPRVEKAVDTAAQPPGRRLDGGAAIATSAIRSATPKWVGEKTLSG
jgi:hypothetical protein